MTTWRIMTDILECRDLPYTKWSKSVSFVQFYCAVRCQNSSLSKGVEGTNCLFLRFAARRWWNYRVRWRLFLYFQDCKSTTLWRSWRLRWYCGGNLLEWIDISWANFEIYHSKQYIEDTESRTRRGSSVQHSVIGRSSVDMIRWFSTVGWTKAFEWIEAKISKNWLFHEI
jgi:hypothetical protein